MYIGDYIAEIRPMAGQKIAVELLKKKGLSMDVVFSPLFRRTVVKVRLQDAVAGRLIRMLKGLSNFYESRQFPPKLVENPVLEEVEKFLAEAGAPEYMAPEEVDEMEAVWEKLFYKMEPVPVRGGYMVGMPYELYFVSEDGDVRKVCRPKHMLWQAAVYRFYKGLPVKLKMEGENIPNKVLENIARSIRKVAPQLVLTILP